MADIVSIGIALDTSKVLQGTRQVDAALKSVATASATTAQATQRLDQAAKAAGQAFGAESTAAQAVGQSLRQKAIAAQEAEQKTRAMQQAAQTAAAALQKEQQAALAAAEALHKKSQATETATSLMDRLKASVGDFGKNVGAFALAQAGLQGLNAVFNTVKETITDIVKTGLQMAQLRGSFAAIAGGVTAGNKEFAFAVDTANKLGLGLQTLAEQYRSLNAATRGTTLAGADTRALFVALSQAAQAYGLSTEQLGRAMAAVQQIISKGKVSMEELRGQLGEALPGAMQITARAYGTNTAALEDMVAKGLDAADWTRRFTAQLKSEVPPAAERAGKGIANLGNEIVLLKDYIAQSGLLSWLDAAARKAAVVLRGLREVEDARKATAAEGLGEALPKSTGVTADKLYADDRQKLLDVSLKLKTAELELLGIQTARKQNAFGILTGAIATSGAEKEVEARIAALKAEKDALAQAAIARAQEGQRAAGRQAEINAYSADEKAIQRDKNAFLESGKKLLEQQRKETEAMTAATKAGLGRDPTAEEKAKLGEKQLKDAQELLENNAKLAEQYKDDPVVKALRERGQAAEAATKAVADGKKEAKADAKDAKAAEAELERLDKERRGNVMDTGKLILKGYEEEGDLITDLMEKTRQLTMTEDARWALKLQAITDPALREQAQQALEEYQLALKHNEALKERPRLLADQARASAAELSALQKAQAAFTARKGEKPAETERRLDAAYRALEQTEGVEPFRLAEAAAKWDAIMKKGLNTEMWDKWAEVGMNALDHVGQALEEFVFKGKADFKGMMDAIAQDLFRFATQTLMQQATKKGGWLEMGLEWGKKALNIYLAASGGGGGSGAGAGGGGGGSTGGASFTGGDAPGMQHGGPVSAGSTYMVGEAGPELFVPRTAGTVLPHGQGVSSPTVVNVHVSGVQDAQSFVQSRGAVSRAMMGALAQARQQM